MNTIFNDMARAMNFKGIASKNCYEDGTLKDCILNEENCVSTAYGELTPKYGPEEARSKYHPSVSFYRCGAIKSIALEKQTKISTTIGVFPAELVTFYESGALKRLFPLNGKISGYWTESDEEGLCEVFRFSFPFGSFKAKIISLCFYENGNLKAVTLWPGETIILKNRVDLYPVRIGFSLYEEGLLKSIEPAYELILETPIGNIKAYNQSAIGISGEANSLCFNRDGSIKALATSDSKIEVYSRDGSVQLMEPIVQPDPLEEDKVTIIPLHISFEGQKVKFQGSSAQIFDTYTNRFKVIESQISGAYSDGAASRISCGDCTKCSLCKS